MIKIKKALCVLLTLVLTFSFLYVLSNATELKTSDDKYKDFFDQKQDFDALFMGTSHVINGVFPMELWNDFGIVSYNFGGHANTVATSYWVMRNALDYTKPKLMIIDCLGLSTMFKTSPSSYSYVHLSLDAFPLSINKIKTVFDLTNDPAMDIAIKEGMIKEEKERTKLELLWNFSIYHSRWPVVDLNNPFSSSPNKEKGAETRIAVTPVEFKNKENNKTLLEETTSTYYLKKMINYCQSNNIEVLLTYLPFPATEEDQIDANTMEKIANEYNVKYINFLKEKVIDYSTDFYDNDSHLNPSGARKVTDYLGKYISSQYKIEDQRNNEKYNNWYIDYDKYNLMKIDNLSKQDKLENYLMLINDKNYDFVIKINNSNILFDERYMNLFKNIGIDYEKINEKTNLIIKKNNRIEYLEKEKTKNKDIVITLSDQKNNVIDSKAFSY